MLFKIIYYSLYTKWNKILKDVPLFIYLYIYIYIHHLPNLYYILISLHLEINKKDHEFEK